VVVVAMLDSRPTCHHLNNRRRSSYDARSFLWDHFDLGVPLASEPREWILPNATLNF
jgi:hypothetical protein